MTDRDRTIGGLLALHPGALARTNEILADLREQPIRYLPDNGCYAITRYDDVVEVLRDTERFSSDAVTGPAAGEVLIEQLTASAMLPVLVGVRGLADRPDRAARVASVLRRTLDRYAHVLLSADPPVHTRHRQAVGYAFRPRRVAAMRDSIAEVATGLLDAFPASGVDIVPAYADPLPMLVIARALGVEEQHMPDFRRWSNRMLSMVGNPRATADDITDYLAVLVEFGDYFSGVIADRRREPRNDLITDIATSRVDAGLLEVSEILPMLQQFLVAGNETTGKLIAWTVLVLLTHAGLRDTVREDPSQTPTVIEEVLRLHTPVLGLYRRTTVDTEIGGCPVPAGSFLWVLYPAANRDPAAFATPDTFCPARSDGRPHVAFGFGPHYCAGAPLARVEAAIAIDALLARHPNIRLATSVDQLTYTPSHALHGLASLPVVY